VAAWDGGRDAFTPSRPTQDAVSRMSFYWSHGDKLAESGLTLLLLRRVQDEISVFYSSVAAPLLERVGLSSAAERGFQHAYALVSSRAFMVDAYQGLAMVPIADA
jgi:hypothetical protein